MGKPLRVLIIEDSEDDVLLLLRELQHGGYDPTFECVDSLAAMSAALDKQPWDIVIADYFLPSFTAQAALALLKEKELDLPFIILSSHIGEDVAVAAMKAGAHDYITKGNQARLIPAIERELREAVERNTRRKAEQALRESEKRFRSLIENALDIITVLDARGIIRYGSPSVQRVLGYKPEDLINKSFFEYIHADDVQKVLAAFAPTAGLRNRTPLQTRPVEFRFRHHNGLWCFLEAVSNDLLHDPDVAGIVVNSRDVTARKVDEETIRHLAYYDALTGLPNRMLLNDRLVQALAHAHRNQQKLAILFLDLDRFKTINDTLGHALGDRLLQGVAQRLVGCLREGDTVARLGGDEFALLLPGINQVDEVSRVAYKILNALNPSFNFEGHELHVTASMGISLYPNDSEDAQTLLKNADTAMYRAKAQGRNNYQFYTSTMNAKALERLMMENSLRHAMEREEFVLYYQPQVNINTEQIVGMEVLVRWQHPELGLISPAKFIPLAEETGFIIPLDEWVLHTACAQNKAWQDAGFPPLRMSVNLSTRHFKRREFVETVARVLKETGLDPKCLELELTESIVMENAEAAIGTLHKLKQMGIYLSLDDFGTGYSSLSYLRRFPIDTLKIDQSFVRNISTDPDDAAIAILIIAMAHSLKLKVIAEGVETEEQLEFLRVNHCDEMQGYYFSWPLSKDAFTQLLRNQKIATN